MAEHENAAPAISYRVLFPERKEQYVQAVADKVSYGGMLIRCSEKLKVGSLVEIELGDAEARPGKLKLLAEVKWTQPIAGTRLYSTGVFYLLPTAGRMFQLFMERNLRSIEKIKQSSPEK
jgi:hypothetical protein